MSFFGCSQQNCGISSNKKGCLIDNNFFVAVYLVVQIYCHNNMFTQTYIEYKIS